MTTRHDIKSPTTKFACLDTARSVPVSEMTKYERECCTWDGVVGAAGWSVFEIVDPTGLLSERRLEPTAQIAETVRMAHELAARVKAR